MTDPDTSLVRGLTALDDDAFEASVDAARAARNQSTAPKSVARVMADRAAARDHAATRTNRP